MTQEQYKLVLNEMGEIAYTVDNAYLLDLQSPKYEILPFREYRKSFSYQNNIRALQVKKWVFDKEQNIGDCFKNVLSLFALGNDTIALVVKRKQTSTEMYFVIQNPDSNFGGTMRSKIELLENSLKGNFPGTKTEVMVGSSGVQETKDLFGDDEAVRSVAVMVNSPSKYSEEYLTQGIDKLLNGIVPKNESEEYTVIFLAESLSYRAIAEIVYGYEDLADTIFPHTTYQEQHGENKSDSVSGTDSDTNSKGTSKAINRTHSVNAHIGFMGIGGGYGYSWGNSKSNFESTAKTHADTKSHTEGTSDTETKNYKSYRAVNVLKKLEQTMERIDKGRANGLWKFSTYVLAKETSVSKNVANYIRSLTQGKESFIEPSVIQEWSKDDNDGHTAFDDIYQYIQYFTQPVFKAKDGKGFEIRVTPTCYVATDELSHVIAFPQNSMQGLPVLKGVQFGREPHLSDNTGENTLNLKIGHAYHMYEEIEKQDVCLSEKELTKHTFITGSTGSGKSTTIYTLLKHLLDEKVHFLVIEPAKGEYKKVFKNRKDVRKFGTNPNLSDMELLRLNPFRFPAESIHVLEHIDRLVEIFNVCWPMYAAMPAILKDAVEQAYQKAGWNLETSKNDYDNALFPNFEDVLEKIEEIINTSEYSEESKGTYNGALKTRVRSLTKGINRMLFTANDLSDEVLFDSNAIVDLSRIGSSETKALIMGILVLKLQEYRMHQGNMNENLQHVTVLEEAHHLLKRTSTEQMTEGANLLGKSVEMLANAIAEMRTYGEGFIIADQAPGLMDMSVIRNTNTKIIHRLPDYSDRELVGKAIGLNDKQIEELTKLETGVAVLSQSNWLEPVLCKAEFTKEISGGEEIILEDDEISFYHKILYSDLETEIKIGCIDFFNYCSSENPVYLKKYDKDDIKGYLAIFLRILAESDEHCEKIYQSLKEGIENVQ